MLRITSIRHTGSDREKFRHINSESFPNLANTFVDSLLRIGILEHYWVAGPNLYKLNPNRKATLETLTTLEVLEASEFVETLHDDELRVRCESMLINTGSPDTLIREASTVLEDESVSEIWERLRVYMTELFSIRSSCPKLDSTRFAVDQFSGLHWTV